MEFDFDKCMKSGFHMFNSYSNQIHSCEMHNVYINRHGNYISEPIGHIFQITFIIVITYKIFECVNKTDIILLCLV